MAVRIRSDGQIVCAAINPPLPGDFYMEDDLHYELSVVRKVLVTTENSHHIKNGGKWWWKGQEPDDVVIDSFYYEPTIK